MIKLCSGADELFEHVSEISDDMTVLLLKGRLDFRIPDEHPQGPSSLGDLPTRPVAFGMPKLGPDCLAPPRTEQATHMVVGHRRPHRRDPGHLVVPGLGLLAMQRILTGPAPLRLAG